MSWQYSHAIDDLLNENLWEQKTNEISMPKLKRQAGQNIRELALKRRFNAIIYFGTAGFLLILPLFAFKLFEIFLKRLPPQNPFLNSFVFLPYAIYGFCVISALMLVVNGMFLWKRANHADQGAKGEEDIAKTMSELELEGWQIGYGMHLGNRLGDVDIVCISPQNKAYAIDVKSHRGEVTTDGKQLFRRMGNTTYPFEKDFLSQAMKQALQVKQQMDLNFVTPIVAFSDAKVSVPHQKSQQVFVVQKSGLISLLKSLG